ncbi:GntR family transcriptional regulator [Actinoplanes octamycinicus]|uniref:GntR family transcriptional regulator n=1 Tax=Actinoplanes octamycinicus TaxID=135948 RepID=A0A7W7H6I1_9ACTN|nr:GntR family transcriptional regulator [Actinoplanes octamycinicus]MBB4744926.1 GntR family transcriptional regulator [Actinoplanes octamycinicus]GIE55511.1 GntR family transcriptional regulator [Actinoplanes octamycinicus]
MTVEAVRGGVPEHGRVPKYYVVKSQLLNLLAELGEGALLPAERDLAAAYGVARSTLRQAISELTMEGRLRAHRGRGTFVAAPKLVQPLALRSYTEALREMGRRPSRRVVTVETVPAGPLGADLGIAATDQVLHLERVLLADDEPLGLESTYLPVARFPGVMDGYDGTGSLYQHMIDRYALTYAAAVERIETVLASPREAMLLDTNPAQPMLLMQRTSSDADGHPIERVRSLYRGDRIGFETHLHP